ncbi:hypothetical protein, partial [Sphingobacterium sp. LRF_L2]|uniref:hypothetical protein n=1 Tax=Sphingobacterium sp. LRF_L2 TaxID=3369421 RepID=UPI003F5D5732
SLFNRPSLAEWCKGRKLDLFPPSFPRLFLKTIPQGAGRLHDIFTETVLFLRSCGFLGLFLVRSWVVLAPFLGCSCAGTGQS